MADITDAIGALTRLFTNPQDYVNKPNVVGPEGPVQSFDANGYPSYVDAKTGQVVRTPMANPSGWQRAFNPGLANYIFGQNQAAINAQPEAERHAAGVRTGETSLANLRWPSLPGEEQKFFGTPERMASELGESNPSPSATEYNANSLEDLRAGNPALRAGTTSSQLGAAGSLAQNEKLKQDELRRLNYPTTEAGSELSNTVYQGNLATGNNALLPKEFQLRDIGLGNDISLAQGLKQRVPDINETEASKAIVDKAIAKLNEEQLPTTEETLKNEMAQKYLGSEWAPVMPAYGTHIVNGNATLERNPIGISDAQMKMLSLGGGPVGQNTMQLPSGKVINFKPSLSTPNSSNRSNDPKVQKALRDAQEAAQQHGVDSKEYHDAHKELEKAHNEVTLENAGLLGVGKDKLQKAIASINKPVRDEGVNWSDIMNQPIGSMLVDRQGNPALSKENQGPSMADIKQALAGWLFGTNHEPLPLPSNQ